MIPNVCSVKQGVIINIAVHHKVHVKCENKHFSGFFLLNGNKIPRQHSIIGTTGTDTECANYGGSTVVHTRH